MKETSQNTRASAGCHACEILRHDTPGAMCSRHETNTSPTRGARYKDDGQRGPIGPVPALAFAYVAGVVPAFDSEGKRVHAW